MNEGRKARQGLCFVFYGRWVWVGTISFEMEMVVMVVLAGGEETQSSSLMYM